MKIEELQADRQRLEKEIDDFVSSKIYEFCSKYNVDIRFDIELHKVFTEFGNELITINAKSDISVKL